MKQMRSYLPAYDLQAPGNLTAVLQLMADNPAAGRLPEAPI